MVPATKILIGISTAGFIRNSAFLDFLYQLERPEGSALTISHGASPAAARNMIIQTGLDTNCTHILFLDDDMAPTPNALMQLLAHDKDIVTGLYLMRNYPHLALAFDETYPDGYSKHMFLGGDKQGLIEVTNAGLGFVLMKTDVFRKMDKPWVTLGELQKDGWCDDISFYLRATKAGFKIHCDLDCCVGHIGQTIITPTYVNGVWYTKYNTGSFDAIQFPQLTEAPGGTN